ncbi:alpha/beta hydrolase family protein [Actinomadura litoris]|uniref:alpha/beta hydrolase family protein n=1 Tax=Actinomadura litoris TaxID=2678616 RepID=UPI001FA773DF|nr:lipase [Actinomadura litoris]
MVIMSRRTVLAAGVVSVLGATSLAQAGAASATEPARKVRLSLPAPTGRAEVGTTELHLVDRSRRDPWMASKPYRELMVTVRYPARTTLGYPVAPQMPAKAAEHLDTVVSEGDDPLVPAGRVDWAATRTHSYAGAPVDRRGGRHPVVLYSPGHRTPRALGTLLTEDLASRGYVVVSIDHTYDPSEVEFPGGRVETHAQPQETPENIGALLAKEVAARSDDARFVLDEITRLNRGRNPDAGQRPLPRGIRGAMDLSRIGMFGHSLGGAASAQAMHDDRRVGAGMNMDGGMLFNGTPIGSVFKNGLSRPFMLMNSDPFDHTAPELQPFWDNLRGWRRNTQLKGSAHNSYTDLVAQVPQLFKAGLISREGVIQTIGTDDPSRAARALDAERAVVGSFFDLQLRHRDDHLLDGPTPRFPDLRFIL